MVATNSMATRSSLELMLDKLQQLDDPLKVDAPPALPVRPVSRARLPRPRRPLQLDDPKRKTALQENNIQLLKKNSNDITTTEKGISNIQKCYRGYKVRCDYKELRGVMALQSFIRGENARKSYNNHRTQKLNAVVLIQRHTRKCFKRRVLEEHQEKSRKVEDNKDYDRVSCSVLIDLQRRVLKSEAKVRRANEENVDLKMQIQDMEERWKQYEEKMESLEKRWQDELSNIQESLALANKNRAPEIRFGQYDSTPRHCLEFSRELVHVESIDHKELFRPQHDRDKLHYWEELLKLKLRFKAWKKDYKNKLRDTRSSLKKLGNSDTAKSQKSWWGKHIVPNHSTAV